MVEQHYNLTQSTVAKGLLDTWETAIGQFVKVYPRDYRRVLEEAQAITAQSGKAPLQTEKAGK